MWPPGLPAKPWMCPLPVEERSTQISALAYLKGISVFSAPRPPALLLHRVLGSSYRRSDRSHRFRDSHRGQRNPLHSARRSIRSPSPHQPHKHPLDAVQHPRQTVHVVTTHSPNDQPHGHNRVDGQQQDRCGLGHRQDRLEGTTSRSITRQRGTFLVSKGFGAEAEATLQDEKLQ